VFDYVEIDSSFYRIPNAFMVKNWCKKTPDHFRFTAKFPKVITHDKRLKDVEKELELFFSSMIYLEGKILDILRGLAVQLILGSLILIIINRKNQRLKLSSFILIIIYNSK